MMIDSIQLDNFKCFKRLYIPLKPLTLIAGANGAGKSSIIQSLLLLRQSFIDKDTDFSKELLLNGDLVELDNAEDLLYSDAEGESPNINITVEFDEKEIRFDISPETKNERASFKAVGDLGSLCSSALFNKDFVYLYADRIHPKMKYRKNVSKQDSRLGDKTASNCVFRFVQAINSTEQIAITSLKNDSAKDTTILRNVSAWLNYIMGYAMDVKAEETEKDTEAKYIYSISNKLGEEKTLSPLNVPFGTNYLLPIVFAILTAPVGSMILIENPESHLHPAAQGRIGELIARCAQAGVQIIVETHSDHLMNGIRYACKKGWLDSNNLEMDLIGLDSDGRTHVRKHVDINDKGNIESWIPGFFDEWEQALGRMLAED